MLCQTRLKIILATLRSFNILYFRDEPEKKHVFAARSEDNVVQWVMKLRQCSYEYLRSQLHTLQSKIFSITGKVSPSLLYKYHIKMFKKTRHGLNTYLILGSSPTGASK